MAPRRSHILIVDDNNDNVFTLERRLRQFFDADIVGASHGRDALARLSEQSFDLVLLDVQMPELDGVAVLESMKRDMRLRSVSVIMVSAVDDFETVLRCIKLGAEDYVQKPFNAELLRARVEAALERKRLRDQEIVFLEQLQQEKARVDDLLHSILPRAIVRDMKAAGRPRAVRYDNVAVLFCDIVGFTEYCDHNEPELVVSQLESFVARLEEISEAHGLEKIKLVGDAFLATAGLERYVDNPARAAANCGLALIDAVRGHASDWHVRVGVHLGPVVAGVMGKRGLSFDIWGDTVNVAARVVSQAAPDTVVVTSALWPYLGRASQGQTLGLIELKGKGRMELISYRGTQVDEDTR